MAKMKEAGKLAEEIRPGTFAENGYEESEYQIDLMELFYRLVEKLRYIIVIGIVGAVVFALVTMMLITPKYRATSKLYVMNASSSAINLSDLQIGNYLASDYQEVFKNWHVHEKVITELGLNYSYSELNDMISISNPADTRILYITVVSENPQEAQTLANTYARVAREFIAEKMETREPTMFEEARLPDKPFSPSLTLNTFLGLCVGLLLSGGFFVVQFLMDDRIRTGDDIERLTGLTTLGMMPIQTEEGAKRDHKEMRKQQKADAKTERSMKE